MMHLADQLTNIRVLSIHAGHPIAVVSSMIINPHDLTVSAFGCMTPHSDKELMLLPQNIRELSREGLVVNHEEELSETDELIRLQDVIKIKYKLIDKPVMTEGKKKLGKVVNFVIDDTSWQIIKIHVQ